MTSAERIQALCEEALKRPDITITEKLYEGGTTAPAPAPVSVSQAAVEVAAPPLAEAPEPAAEPVTRNHTEQDQDLASMLESRDEGRTKRAGRARVGINLTMIALIAGLVSAVMFHPTLRGKFDRFVGHLGESAEDVKTLGNTKGSFDKALEGVAARGDQIDGATRSIGGDPDRVAAVDDLEMTAEMTEFTGEEADGFGTRRAKLGRMGVVTEALTGMEAATPGGRK